MLSKTFKVFLVSVLTSVLFLSFSSISRAQTQEDFERLSREVQEQMDSTHEDTVQKSEELEDTVLDMFDTTSQSIEENQAFIQRIFSFFALGGIALLVVGIVLILLCIGGFIFDIVMIVDCAKRDFKDKGLWLAILIAGGLLNLGLIAGLIYLFAVKKKQDKKVEN